MFKFLKQLLNTDSDFFCLKEKQMYELNHEIQKDKNLKNYFIMF